MKAIELTKLDKEISAAHANLVALNNEYNELLTSIYNSKNTDSVPNVSERFQRLVKKRGKFKGINLVIIIGMMFANCIFELPALIYNIVFFLAVMEYSIGTLVFTFKISQEVVNSEKKVDSKDTNKEELYEKVCKARELYHSLRKQRDDAVVLVDYDEKEEASKGVENISESAKVLSLEVKGK